MVWFKVDDGFYRSRKVRLLGRDRLPAVGLWTLGGDWSADNLSDGFVPWIVIEDWDPKRTLARKLISVNLWEESTQDGETGIMFHDWPDYQPTRTEVNRARATQARRTALHRDPQLTGAVRQRDQDRCRYCSVTVSWKDRRGGHGGTYDHVDPEGGNLLDNVVVACRGCSSSKGRRTPDQAGMRLLPPGTSSLDLGSTHLGSSSVLDTSQVGAETELGRFLAPTRPDPTRVSTNGDSVTQDPETLPRGKNPQGSARGTRIPDDFAVTEPMVEWARTNTPHVDGRYETQQFTLYWQSESGARASKKDWVLAWKRWMSKAEHEYPRRSARPQQAARRTKADNIRGWQSLKDRGAPPAITQGDTG